MFPLEFPMRILTRLSNTGAWVLDPFCGRGTTNFAARLLGLPSIGFDTSPVAVAIATSKIVETDARSVLAAAKDRLNAGSLENVPTGEFWRLAYHPDTLESICRLRSALAVDCHDPASLVLRAILLGALHGPLTKGTPSYLSNQCLRTFAPKPKYAVEFWKSRSLKPRNVDIFDLIKRRAYRYLSSQLPSTGGQIFEADSKELTCFDFPRQVSAIVTSPPYYGMKTYVPDQWLRNWFLGGSSEVEYNQPNGSLLHTSPTIFASELQSVWQRVAEVCRSGAKLVCRFGSINDRKADPIDIIKLSFRDTAWQVTTIRNAGSAVSGKRQALQFGDRPSKKPKPEFDIYAVLNN